MLLLSFKWYIRETFCIAIIKKHVVRLFAPTLFHVESGGKFESGQTLF